MIKILVGSIVILALTGGAVQFKSTDEYWSLTMNKEVAKHSVQNGVLRIYDFGKSLFDDGIKQL
ncbi:hypothetical protein BTHERMOSOX_1805 [Bathymodiolus thermophilus thioautotrophic gill symbiont]|jgi:hypothetical protein|uniref:Uncharacterized protein n=1 Tax=Bathymodiolus thermophilus thioautotrophic gill symbiont TaxID=2360 RepID=A0A3G3IMB6_9GAMM|nr:hypothetical protein [Bathymodiolus thermophilus thioautotrophic gill symbiont]AYQ56714.1 hypothetical protein MS2017_1002 [Bathymodiolus thermophilus thioautotrophic gill symbiont]CAB5495857.1 hypothetical protein THERMOT_391 [Bathymodiolus thermophilus thioautotrophic gill symbiont]CAB5502766.1 hypothetical protein THERMOS_1666 [Bathymodiolus thermophilus thioautotrophic gill symbiont]SGZ85463.1 hypothetical protein BTHERMOSOX_1805 [Bathymodiolus thermophilus thioautotrophic gill symbiont]